MNKNILNDLLNSQGHLQEDELSAYLSGKASSATRKKVENAMLDNPLYSDAVEGYQEMGLSNVPALEDFSDFKKKLPTVDEAKVVPMNLKRLLSRVAAVAAVVVLGFFAYSNLQPATPDSLFASYYTSYDNDISLTRRGHADGLNKDFKKALGHYAVGEFNESIPVFGQALATEPNNVAAHFFAGMACLEMHQSDAAIKHLDMVKNSDSVYAGKANWYSILATIQSTDTAKAKTMLQEYVQGKGYKMKEAKALLEEL